VSISNFMKIYPVGAELFHVDRWIDMTKLNCHFVQFCEHAQKYIYINFCCA